MKRICSSILFATLVYALPLFADPIKVGAILPLSGVVAPWGEQVRSGLETSNALLGNKFQIVYEDEGPCVARDALSAYRKLTAQSGIKIIFLGCLAGSEALAPAAARDDVLLLSLGLLNESVLASGAKVINLATEIGVEGQYLADYISREGASRIASMVAADAFGAEFAKVLKRELQHKGRTIVSENDAQMDSQTFVPEILNWKKQKVDLLVTSLSDKHQAILYKEMRKLGFTPIIYSTYVLESFAPAKAERGNFEGIKYTHPVNSAEQMQEYQQVFKSFKDHEKDGRATSVNAFFAYDGMTNLIQAFTQCQPNSPACLYQFFQKLGVQDGISGQMKFHPNGALTRPYGLKIVKNGEFEWVEKASI